MFENTKRKSYIHGINRIAAFNYFIDFSEHLCRQTYFYFITADGNLIAPYVDVDPDFFFYRPDITIPFAKKDLQDIIILKDKALKVFIGTLG